MCEDLPTDCYIKQLIVDNIDITLDIWDINTEDINAIDREAQV